MKWKTFAKMLQQTSMNWGNDHAPTFAAAIAFYMIFSLVPLLAIAMAVSGLIFPEAVASEEIRIRLTTYLGDHGARLIQSIVAASASAGNSILAIAASSAILFFTATTILNQVQCALNVIWKKPPPPRRWFIRLLRRRASTFLMVLVVGAMLVVSLGMGAAIGWADTQLGDMTAWQQLYKLQFFNHAVSYIIYILLLAMIYKFLPDAIIYWHDVWLGAAVTAALILAGQLLIGFYLTRVTIISAYGAAGSLALLLLWVYYLAMVFLFGAEFTHVYACVRDQRREAKETGNPL